MRASDDQRFPWIRSLAVSLIAGGFYFLLNNWPSISPLLPASMQLPSVRIPSVISLASFYIFSIITAVKLFRKYVYDGPSETTEEELSKEGSDKYPDFQSATTEFEKRQPKFQLDELPSDIPPDDDLTIIPSSESDRTIPSGSVGESLTDILDIVTDYTVDEEFDELLKNNGYNVGKLPQNIRPSECEKLGASLFITDRKEPARNVSYDTVVTINDIDLDDDEQKEAFLYTVGTAINDEE